MNINEVPQDKKHFNQSEVEIKKVLYVTDKEGNYTQTQSYGWESENLVLEQVWAEVNDTLAQARKNVLEGNASPIAYYMIKNRMDIAILAAYVNKWQWQVKRHLKPKVFENLSESILSRYATAFNISVEDLKNIATIK